MTISGSPDWLRRTITDATVVVPRTAIANGTNTFTNVPSGGVPTGYHGLIVAIDPSALVDQVTVVGKTSGITWGQWITSAVQPDVVGPMACMYESAIDSQVTVTVVATAAAGHVAVYAVGDTPSALQAVDGPRGGGQPAFTRQVGGYQNGSQQLQPFTTDSSGCQFQVPVAPASFTGTHPPNELNLACAVAQTATVTIAAAPGAGFRYRCWGAAVFQEVFPSSGTPSASISGLTGSVSIPVALSTTTNVQFAGAVLAVPVGGLPCPTNRAIQLAISGANGAQWGGWALVSVEAV